MRRTFLNYSRRIGTHRASGIRRLYRFSFGTLLATSLEQFRAIWTPDDVGKVLSGLKKSWGHNPDNTISVDVDPGAEHPLDDRDKVRDDFINMARDHNLYVKTRFDDRVHARLLSAMRFFPKYGGHAFAAILGTSVAGVAGGVAGVGLGEIVKQNLKDWQPWVKLTGYLDQAAAALIRRAVGMNGSAWKMLNTLAGPTSVIWDVHGPDLRRQLQGCQSMNGGPIGPVATAANTLSPVRTCQAGCVGRDELTSTRCGTRT